MNPERRALSSSAPTANGRIVSGYAATFSTRSENLGGSPERPLFEIIAPGAFDKVLLDDIVACYNHAENQILARSKNGKGTLKLTVDNIGLRYEFEAPDTTAGNDLLVSIKRGDITGSSFAFTVAKGGDTYTQEGPAAIRTIFEIGRLYDVSPVVRPAYADSTVTTRSTQATTLETPRANGWRRMFDLLK